MSDWDWHLRLFFSADLIGSTALKSTFVADSDVQEWPRFFREFYQDLPARFEKAYAHLPSAWLAPGDRIRLWKTLGDEMLFEVEILRFQETLYHVWAFKRAISTFNREWADKPLRLKGAAWLAGFPVTNVQVTITLPESCGGHRDDFIGPSIDTGFRLSRLATDRKLMVSADLALMLMDAVKELDAQKLVFYFDGWQHLRGVLGERPYPAIWVDLCDGAVPLEEKLMGLK